VEREAPFPLTCPREAVLFLEIKTQMRRAAILAGLLALLAAHAVDAETFESGGTRRNYTAIIPKTTPAPLVLVLHGNTQKGEDMRTRTSWPDVAKREGFVAVFPDGLNRAWADLRGDSGRVGRSPPAGTDDAAFLRALVTKFVRDGVADPRRVYVTGISNGGHMTLTLACTHAELLAAAASVIASFTEPMMAACKPSRPVPMLMMNGTVDPLIAYGGGRGTSRYAVPNVVSTEANIAFWRKNNGCAAGDRQSTKLPDKDKNDSSTVTRVDSDCPDGRDVVLYRVDRGGHRMPGSFPDARFVRVVDAILGPQNRDIDGAETIWAFFKTHTAP
jgi:polyhydroxybutyrate depolymerase